MKKKNFFKSLCLIIVFSFCFTSMGIYAGENTGTSVTVEGTTLYANGNDVTLKKNSDGKIYIYGNNGTKLLENSVAISTIYGGSKNKSITADVNITVDGVNVTNIYGGGYSNGSGNADVNGNVSINVIGNANAGSVYGGGNAKAEKDNAQAHINGSVFINIPAKPPKNHGNIYGGGYAYSSTDKSATANVNGNVKVYITDRTYSVRGGGIATTSAMTNGLAQADVNGSISIKTDAVDIREVYGGGYASNHAQANAKNISIDVYNNSEIMILSGGGHASNGATANVNNVSLSLVDCINIYGYIRGGGYASSGGASRTNNVALLIKNSIMPCDEQFGTVVSAGIYGGGQASGGTSIATTNSVAIDIQNSETAATIYSGGQSSKDSQTAGYGNAKVNSAKANYSDNVGSVYGGQTYESTVIAQGSSEDKDNASVTKSEISVVDCQFDGIWGSGEAKGDSFPMAGQSQLTVTKELHAKTMTGFDTVVIKAPLYLEKIGGKSETESSVIVVDDTMPVGTPLIYCNDIINVNNVLTIKDNQLDYTVKDKQSVWSLGQMTYQIVTKANTGGTIQQSQTVNKFASTTVSWTIDKGYQVDKILVDGKAVSTHGTSYTFDDVRKNHTLEVQFKKAPGVINDEIIVEVKPGQEIPKVSVDLNADKVNDLLSEEDKILIAEGKSIQFNLAIETIDNIPKMAQQEIEKIIDKENVLMTFDISLFKSIDGNKLNISNANSKIKIVMDIPKEYIIANYGFAILRTHQNSDGSFTSEVLKDLDDNVETITFETDKFSIYSLIYDVKKGEIVERPEIDVEKDPSQNVVETDDNSNSDLYIFTMLMSIVVLYIVLKKKNGKISQ